MGWQNGMQGALLAGLSLGLLLVAGHARAEINSSLVLDA